MKVTLNLDNTVSFMCFLWSQEIIKSHRNTVHCVTPQKQDDLETATDGISG